MLTRSVVLRGIALAAVLGLAPGCDRGAPAPTSVHGRVSYHGWPVAGARVIFVPDLRAGGSGPLAQAETDAEGFYTVHGEDGADVVPGRYRITVMPLAGPPDALPDPYRDPDLSGLSAEVQAGADNVVDLNLK